MKLTQISPARALTVIVVVLVAGYFLFEQFFTYTSNAFVASDVVVIAPQVSGHIQTIDVKRNQTVSAEQPLINIDPEPYELTLQARQAALLQVKADLRAAEAKTELARAELEEAQAKLDNANSTLARNKVLLDTGDISQQTYDNYYQVFLVDQAAVAAAEEQIKLDLELESLQQANIEEAEAQLAHANYNLQQTQMQTPIDGIIAPYTIRPGAYVDSGTALMAVVSADDWRVVANVREQHAARLRPGMTVWFQVSTSPWRIHRGTVRSVSPGVSRQLDDDGVLPYVALSDDWIRLSQRFPVEIDIGELDTTTLLHGGDARIFVFH
ncbi:MAG: HlyD family secretion protein [Pseudomonadota bacterium]